jgi:hypothetical protein
MGALSQIGFLSGRPAVRGLLAGVIAMQVVEPVLAYSPEAPCGWLDGKGRFAEPSDFENVDINDEETYPDVEEAWPRTEANDFVSFLFWADNEAWNIGLQHCPTGKGLLIFTTPETSDTMRDVFDAAMEDDAKWSIRDVSRKMRKMGAVVRMRSGGIGTCACENAETE